MEIRAKLKFDLLNRLIPAVNKYDNQFRVYDNSTEISISGVIRDSIDHSVIMITLATTASDMITLSYGDVTPSGLGIWYTNVVKNANGLPAPRFGPLVVQNIQNIYK